MVASREWKCVIMGKLLTGVDHVGGGLCFGRDRL